VPGKRLGLGKPVYVLTSKRTFSAAEEFTYNLKNLKRAVIVGEVTGGGAHPGGGHPINAHFGIGVPSGRAINPISKTNWEGTGVAPDIEAPADQALKVAHLEALKKVRETNSSDPRFDQELKRAIETTEKELAELRKKSS
jgi:C-terminal processing protease CtpA/Prc